MWKSKSAGDSSGGWRDQGGAWSSGDAWVSRSGAGSFSPPDISGLVLWLESTTGTQVVGSNIREWVDQSPPGGTNAIQTTSADRPGYTASDPAFNGQPSINFDGATQYFNFTANSVLIAPCTVVVCGSPNNATASVGYIMRDSNSVDFAALGGTTQQMTANAGTALNVPSQIAPAAAHAGVWAAQFNGAASAIFQNAPFAAVVQGATGAGAVGGVAMNLGAGAGGFNFFQGSLVEVLVYNSVLSSVQLRQVFRYLKLKYSVSAVVLDFANPTSIAGCQEWIRSDLGITTVSGAVSGWADQSGTGDANRNLAQAIVGERPTYNAVDAAYGGHPSLSFLASASQNLNSGAWSASLAQPCTVMLVGQSDESSTQGFFDDNVSVEGLSVFVESGPLVFAINGGTFIDVASSLPASPCVIAAVYNGASSALYLNGGAPAVTGTIGSSATLHGMTVGSFSGGSDPLNGKVVEQAVYNYALSPQQIELLSKYAGARYGISVS